MQGTVLYDDIFIKEWCVYHNYMYVYVFIVGYLFWSLQGRIFACHQIGYWH
jgi:hypothetical protein